MNEYLTATLLGFVEGLTEFLPVSSTGHLILLIDGMNFPSPPGRVFEVFIQLGAILAVMVLYRTRLWNTVRGLHNDPQSQKFAMNVIAGTVPALILGALFHSYIKTVLYDPLIIATTLILGGFVILIFDRKFTTPSIESVDELTLKKSFLIGCCQSVALIPGVSRSGATIMGALGLGLSRKAAMEFSFFLAIPVMICAVAYDLLKNWDALIATESFGIMFAGLIAAFLTAMVVIKAVLGWISRYGFMPFAWYRIAIGILAFWVFL